MSSSAHRFIVHQEFRRLAMLLASATTEQLLQIGHEIEERSAARAPRGATGDLASTHRVEEKASNWGTYVKIIFGTPSGMPYVVVQHEHTDFQHPNGGEAKFLEKTVNEMTPRIATILAQHLRQNVLGGG